MYECPNCGGALRFDVPSQKLHCDHCDTSIDPYEYRKDQDAEEKEEYETKVYTCPQCGGEILTNDNTAAAFCSYCGASTILDSSLRKEKRPKYIIPFKKTKQDCKAAYQKLMRAAWFAPKELKDPVYVDSFRGIYMPYWSYVITQHGDISMEGTHETREGDYIITRYYDLSCNVDAQYAGITYDASSTFDDHISEDIAPYHVHDMVEFTPSYLCGFYADTADVEKVVYQPEAMDLANAQTYEKIYEQSEFRSVHLSKPMSEFSGNATLGTDCSQTDSAMFPVWFLAYRKGNRVAYATMNGETGKMAADLPADEKKFVLGSLLLAIPFFFLLNIFMTVIPLVTATCSGVVALISGIIYTLGLFEVVNRTTHADDVGYLSKKTDADGKPYENAKRYKIRQEDKVYSGKAIKIISYIATAIVLISIVPFSVLSVYVPSQGAETLSTVLIIVYLVLLALCMAKASKAEKMHALPEMMGGFIGVIVPSIIIFIKPVSDLYYYGSAIAAYVGTFFTILAIIGKYNILATRELPEFQRQGGDDRA